MILHGPCLELTDAQSLHYNVWHELPTGIICKLYARADWVNAYMDFRLLVPGHKKVTEQGDNMQARCGRTDIELTCTDDLCLITIADALDA